MNPAANAVANPAETSIEMPSGIPGELEAVLVRRLATVARAAAQTPERRTLCIVVREPDTHALVRGLARMHALLAPHDSAAWLANYTKVRVFAGNPTRAGVASLLQWSEAGTVGFALIDAATPHPRIADLLPPLRTRQGPHADARLDVVWGEALTSGRAAWTLGIDTRDLDWPRYFVHIAHLLAEAAIDDPGFGGRIDILHRATPPACTGDVAHARIEFDASPPVCRALLRSAD